MPQDETYTWTGESGKQYPYWVYPKDTNFEAAPGNYIFAQRIGASQYRAIYVGQTSDLSERFESHHQRPCIDSHGATHIHVRRNDGDQARLDEEMDIRRNYRPPCNQQ